MPVSSKQSHHRRPMALAVIMPIAASTFGQRFDVFLRCLCMMGADLTCVLTNTLFSSLLRWDLFT